MRAILSVLVVCIAGGAAAAPYNGSGPGVSVIDAGGGGDYLSLQSAVNAINATPLTGGDWVFEIASNLSVSTKVVLGQETNGNSITFRPATGANVTVTFNPGSTFSGWGSHWVIGATSTTTATPLVSTNNIIIDGNNGTIDHALTLRNSDTGNAVTVLSFVGDSDGGIVRNTRIQQRYTGDLVLACLRLGSYNAGSFANATPDNYLIENNLIENLAEGGLGVSVDRSGEGADTLGSNDVVVRGNVITAPMVGVRFAQHRSATVEGNTIAAVAKSTGRSATGIAFQGGTTAASGDSIIINGNTITEVESIGVGRSSQGIFIKSVADAGAAMDWQITNNVIKSVTTTLSGVDAPAGLQGIVLANVAADLLIAHNSVSIEDSPGGAAPMTNSAQNGAITVLNTASSEPIIVRNNAVRNEANGGSAIAISAPAVNLDVDHNLYGFAGGSTLATIGGVDYATLGDLQTNGVGDDNSVVLDPLLDPEGRWTSLTDLTLSAIGLQTVWGAPRIAAVSEDRDGTARDATTVYKGAYELIGFASAGVAAWWRIH